MGCVRPAGYKSSALTMKFLYARQAVTQSYTKIGKSFSEEARKTIHFSSVPLCVFSVKLCVTFLVLACPG